MLPSLNASDALVALGKTYDWPFVVLGYAPLPTQEVSLPGWKIVPAQCDDSLIPISTVEKVKAVFASGIAIKGFLLVHEVPKELPMPEDTETIIDGEFTEVETPKVDIATLVERGLTAGVAALKIAGGLAVGLASVVLPAIFFLGSALLVDPILIAITEDGAWVEIDRWFE